MAPTPEATAKGYAKMWDEVSVLPVKKPNAQIIARTILANREKYDAVTRAIGVPIQFLGPVHYRESANDFRGVLHNGQKIIGTGQKTTIVPKGKGPFNTWHEAAIDACKSHGLDKVKNWSVERTLFEQERWNGWGYLGKINTPYVWSWTNKQQRGKYIADGRFDPNVTDVQGGCAAIMLALNELMVASDVAPVGINREPVLPKEVVDAAVKEATSGERKTAAGAVVVGGAAGATKAGTTAPDPAQAPAANFSHAWLLPVAIAAAIAVIVIVVVRIQKKRDKIVALVNGVR